MRRTFALLLFSVVGIKANAFAQTAVVLDDAAEGSFRAVTNALVALSGDDGLADGSYTFKNEDSPDAELELYKVAAKLPLADSRSDFIPVVEVSPSYLELEQKFDNAAVPGKITVDSKGLGVGIGLQMKFLDDSLELTPGFKVNYSQVDFDASLSGRNADAINDALPDIDTWTYIPSFEADLRQDVGDGGDAVLFNSRVSGVFVEGSPSNHNFEDFSDYSTVWKNRLSYVLAVRFPGMEEVLLRPNIARVDLFGATKDGFGFSDFYEVGLDVLSRRIAADLFKEVGVGAAYLHSKELDGWRFGLVLKLS